jgi:hypothetical protein
LAVIRSRHPAVTAALLAVRIKVADFNGLASTILPFDMSFDIFHFSFLPTYGSLGAGFFGDPVQLMVIKSGKCPYFLLFPFYFP